MSDTCSNLPASIDVDAIQSALDSVSIDQILPPSSSSAVELSKEPSSPSGRSLHELVVAIADALGDPKYDKQTDVPKVTEIMKSYDASLGEWRRYSFFDDSKNYTRNLVATDNKTFTLMLLCWNPRKASPIHAHEGANCWMRIVEGSIRESRYAWPSHDDEPLSLVAVTDVPPPGVAYISDDIGLHKVENPAADELCVTLHLYSPPFEQCKIFLNPATSTPSTCRMTFYSEHGHKVEYH